jgi:hypothetical protein
MPNVENDLTVTRSSLSLAMPSSGPRMKTFPVLKLFEQTRLDWLYLEEYERMVEVDFSSNTQSDATLCRNRHEMCTT